MPRTLFSLVCPDCGSTIELDGLGRARCASCRQGYLVRVGHLIVDPSSGAASASGRPSRGSS